MFCCRKQTIFKTIVSLVFVIGFLLFSRLYVKHPKHSYSVSRFFKFWILFFYITIFVLYHNTFSPTFFCFAWKQKHKSSCVFYNQMQPLFPLSLLLDCNVWLYKVFYLLLFFPFLSMRGGASVCIFFVLVIYPLLPLSYVQILSNLKKGIFWNEVLNHLRIWKLGRHAYALLCMTLFVKYLLLFVKASLYVCSRREKWVSLPVKL